MSTYDHIKSVTNKGEGS